MDPGVLQADDDPVRGSRGCMCWIRGLHLLRLPLGPLRGGRMNVRRGLPAVGLAVILATGPAALVLFGPTLSQAGAAVPADDPVTETVTTTVTETPPPVTETATVTATETTTATETDTATATNTTTSTATTTAHSTSTVRSTSTRMLPGATSYRTLPGGTVVRTVVVRTVVTPSV